MTAYYFRIFMLVATVTMIGPLASHAQTSSGSETDGDSNGTDPGYGGETQGVSSTAPTASTDSVVSSIDAARKYCKLISSAYAIDCLGERLGEVAKQLKGQNGFEDVQAALETASGKLNDIARQNRSATNPPATFRNRKNPPVTTTRRLIPVDDAKLDLAASQAIAVIAEAETRLLRSAEGSTDRSIQYQQIASAIGSNKVLLRSV